MLSELFLNINTFDNFGSNLDLWFVKKEAHYDSATTIAEATT